VVSPYKPPCVEARARNSDVEFDSIGAGISTPAIPDFRSSTGLFKTLAKDPYSHLGTSPAAEAENKEDEGDYTDRPDASSSARVLKRRKSELGETIRRSRRIPKKDEEEGSNSESDATAEPGLNSGRKRMTVGGVGGIRSGKDLFDVRCLSDPSLLPAHHSLLNTLHRLTLSTPPTLFHEYMKTLDDEGRLLRVYTQNIDGLEAKVGLDLRPPANVVEEIRTERKWKRERSRRELNLGKAQPPSPPTDIFPTVSRSESEGAVDRVVAKDLEPLSMTVAPMVTVDQKDLDEFRSNRVFSPSRQSSPSRFSTADEGGDSLSEADRALAGSDIRSRSNTPQPDLDLTRHARPGTPGSAKSVSSVKTDLSAQYGFLRTPTKIDSMPESFVKPSLLPRAVPLHGVLSTMDCTRCSYSQSFETYYPLPADLLSCPSCEETQEERLAANQRARSVGVLRASVLLYNEPSKHDTAIGEIVEKDVLGIRKDDRPDLLIVAGTTLKIPGVIKIVKQLSNALRMNYPDEKTRAKNKARAANRKRKRKMRDEGTLPLETSDGSGNDTESEDDGEPFTVENFPVRTILLNRDAPAKSWEDTFDVWVQGDLQDFMQSWVTHGPTPAEVEESLEWMWKKGARERNRLAKAKLNGSFRSGADASNANPADLLAEIALSKKKSKILLGIPQIKAEQWLSLQQFGWERPHRFSQLTTISRSGAGVRKDSMTSCITERIDEELETLLQDVPPDYSPDAIPQTAPADLKRVPRSRKAKPQPLALEAIGEVQAVEITTAVPLQSAKRGKKASAEKPIVKKASRPKLPFTVVKPGGKSLGDKPIKTQAKKAGIPVEPLPVIKDGPMSIRSLIHWDRLVDGSLSPPPPSSEADIDIAADLETEVAVAQPKPRRGRRRKGSSTVNEQQQEIEIERHVQQPASKQEEDAPRRSARGRIPKVHLAV
jgi:NAD-dependent SIR2 family protein deacetylase